ncbi:hypothetical protein CF319_g3575 [Tilletia indica]|nr:hypothetical protein CF319_g3575 [Tilletia indica]
MVSAKTSAIVATNAFPRTHHSAVIQLLLLKPSRPLVRYTGNGARVRASCVIRHCCWTPLPASGSNELHPHPDEDTSGHVEGVQDESLGASTHKAPGHRRKSKYLP